MPQLATKGDSPLTPSLSNDQRHDAALTVASQYPDDPSAVQTVLLMLGLAVRSPAGVVAEGTDEFEMPWFTPRPEGRIP